VRSPDRGAIPEEVDPVKPGFNIVRIEIALKADQFFKRQVQSLRLKLGSDPVAGIIDVY
jgi:hypothetical protein